MSGENASAPNRCNPLPWKVRTSRQKLCDQRVCCLQWLGSRDFGRAIRSVPRLLSTFPWGMIRMSASPTFWNLPHLCQFSEDLQFFFTKMISIHSFQKKIFSILSLSEGKKTERFHFKKHEKQSYLYSLNIYDIFIFINIINTKDISTQVFGIWTI